MSTTTALETLPPQDSALTSMLSTTDSVRLTRDNTKLLEVVRVLRGAPGLKALEVMSAGL